MDLGVGVRGLRTMQPSLAAVAMIAPASLLALYLWSTTPTVVPPSAPYSGGAGTLLRLAIFLVAWLLMTAAMMLPSAMPLLISLDRLARSQAGRRYLPVLAASGYLAVWELVGIGAWMTTALAEAYLLPRASSQVASGIAGAGLVLMGLYGLSPQATACLRACRRPFGFLARYWRGEPGVRWQAVRIGAAYGVSCVGCCVPMLGVMFVVGMANVAIVIAMGGLMAVMKTSQAGNRVAHLLAVGLIGVGVAIGFAWLPFSPHHH